MSWVQEPVRANLLAANAIARHRPSASPIFDLHAHSNGASCMHVADKG